MGQIFRKLWRHAPLLAMAGLVGVSTADAGRETRPFFVPHAVVAAGTHVKDFAVADFTGDGTPDLAVVTGSSAHWKTDTVSVLRGLGGGAFRAGPRSPTKLKTEAAGVWTADFNGDGKADVAVSRNDDFSENTDGVTILLGSATGALTLASGSPLEVPGLAAVAELNGDGKADLIAIDEDDRVVSWLGDGTGRFSRSGQLAVAGLDYSRTRVVVADFNDDGHPDLAVSPLRRGSAVLLGLGSARFAPARRVTTAAGVPAAGDFDGDGKADLALAGKTLAVLRGDGAAGFAPAPGSPIRADYREGIVATDLNGDHSADIAATNGRTVTVLLATGAGRFRRVRGTSTLPIAPKVVAAADLTGDGSVDLAARVLLFHDAPKFVAEGSEWRVVILSPALPTSRPTVSHGRALPRSTATLTVGGAVYMLAADGDRAAVLATGKAGGSCSLGLRILVWNASSRKTTNIKDLLTSECFAGDAADTSVMELAIGGNTVAWITAGEAGNTQGWHDFLVAQLPGGTAKRIDHVDGREEFPENAGWLGYLYGNRGLLAYDRWQSRCDPPPAYGCDPYDPWTRVGRASLVRIAGRRRIVAKRGADAYRLVAVGGGRMAVETADGSVKVLAPNGARIAAVPAPNGDLPLSVALSSHRLAVVRWSRTLDLYNPATGGKRRSLPLAETTPLTLAGINDRLALLRGQGVLVLVRLKDGRMISPQLPPRLVGAALTERGLFYAYGARTRKSRIAFESNAALLKGF